MLTFLAVLTGKQPHFGGAPPRDTPRMTDVL